MDEARLSRAASADRGILEPQLDGTLQQVRRIIGEVELDCSCRGALYEALDHFSRLQVAQVRRMTLRNGRRAKATIAAVLDLLADLDETQPSERDRSAFEDFAVLFETIAAEAVKGAGLMRQMEKL